MWSSGPSTSPLAVIHMRIATFVLLGSISLNAWGNSAMCGDAWRQHADLLTPEQWQAVLNEKAGGDPVLEEAIAVEKYKYQERSPKSKDHTPIDWAQVRKLVLLGAVKETFEHADLTVALVTVSGRAYTSREPHAGDLGRLTDVVDPCGVYILRVLE